MSRPGAGTMTARIVAAAAGMTVVSMLIVGSFTGALHRPVPHGLPVGVVGPQAAAHELGVALGEHAPGAFTVARYGSEAAARRAILDRAADAALLPGPGPERLLVAGAAGAFTKDAVTSVFGATAARSGQHLVIKDLRPLPPGDPDGICQLFLFIGLALPSIGFGIALASVIGRRLPAAARLAALAGYAIVVALAAAWVTDGIIGALAGAPLGLIGIAALTAFAIAAACAAAVRLAGVPLAALLALLIVPVGIPAAGGPFGAAFVTRWYGDLGSALPAGAMMPAVRNIIYFGGSALNGPLLVL